jgi:hypothetical protein
VEAKEEAIILQIQVLQAELIVFLILQLGLQLVEEMVVEAVLLLTEEAVAEELEGILVKEVMAQLLISLMVSLLVVSTELVPDLVVGAAQAMVLVTATAKAEMVVQGKIIQPAVEVVDPLCTVIHILQPLGLQAMV